MIAGTILLLAASASAQLAPFQLIPVVRKSGGPAYVRKPTEKETKEMADEIARKLDALDDRLKEENAEFDRESFALAGGRPSREDLARALAKYPKAPIFLEMTILARRLRVYRDTGELPADIPDRAAIRALLEKPWERRTPMPALETDIVKLEAQVARYARLMLPKPAPSPKTETLPPPAAKPAPAPAAPSAPLELASDAGRGREQIDPIPPLLKQLFSPDPRQRALAADELAQHGAREAVTPLTLALADPDARVRASAALALGALGPVGTETLEALGEALRDKSEDVRFSARSALQRLQ